MIRPGAGARMDDERRNPALEGANDEGEKGDWLDKGDWLVVESSAVDRSSRRGLVLDVQDPVREWLRTVWSVRAAPRHPDHESKALTRTHQSGPLMSACPDLNGPGWRQVSR